MQLFNGLHIALLGWQMYTPTYASPLSLTSAPTSTNLDLAPEALSQLAPTGDAVPLSSGDLITPLPTLAPTTTNITLVGGYPPDPCIIRLPGSSISVEFYSRHYLKENRVQQVLRMAQVACNQHNPNQAIFKTAPTKYSAGKTTLAIPSRYQGELKWGQWSLGLDAVRVYMERWDWLGCEFHMYDHNINRWYYDGHLLVDFMQNMTAVQNETVTATE